MTWEIRQGHVLTRLAEMPDESVHCVVTSPPYYGLRDYGIDGQLGLEASPDEYVARMVEVFREVRRVLRADGTLWLNIGDSYTAGAGSRNGLDASGLKRNVRDEDERQRCLAENKVYRAERVQGISTGVKAKDLLGIPWLLAFALRSDGWFLRSDIIWSKPNPMPESVTDRPTSAHEHVFLLTKSARYHYDADAIREEYAVSSWTAQAAMLNAYGNGGRNKRNVWEIATVPFAEAHFAVFPVKLVEPCVLAGSSPRVCGVCAAPWRRVTERAVVAGSRRLSPEVPQVSEAGQGRNGRDSETFGEYQEVRTTGWDPSCEHSDDSGRSVVLDPFAGSGTVGVVTEWHGRDFVGIELNAEYAEMARRRIAAEGPLGRAASRPRALSSDHLALFES